LAVAALALGWHLVGNSDEDAAADPGPIHVHALGVNPADGALIVATHTGLYRIARGDGSARRVTDRRQDTMGFTVVGHDRFLGSGHPDLRDELPPLLGLIESRDAGRTWSPVSLTGEADFHALRARGERIVGYDATNGRILTSRDGGRGWSVQPFVGPLVDLVIDPAGSETLLATTQAELLISRDSGRTWRALSETTGLLAWPGPNRLYLLAPDGRLWASADRGRRWQPRGEIGGRPAAFATSLDGRMHAALHSGAIKESSDGGRSWRTVIPPQ
jgi:hypothetical protein